jgi:hypothetical protein
VTDNGGRTDSAQVVITPNSATTSAPAAAGDGCSNAAAPALQIAVCPVSASVTAGGAGETFDWWGARPDEPDRTDGRRSFAPQFAAARGVSRIFMP